MAPHSKIPPVLCWLDLEMTGLEPSTDAIVQLAVILTNTQLEELAPALELTIWQPPAVLAAMCPFVRHLHQKTGLLAQIERSEVSLQEAEREVMQLLTKHASYGTARLCGNSIHQDRRFLEAHMKSFAAYISYRQIDVSSIKELSTYWEGEKYRKPEEGQHTALFDVRQSLAELKHYREHLFIPACRAAPIGKA